MTSDNRIRVLHYIPCFRYGGIESLFIDYCKRIDRSRFKFDLLTETEEELPVFDELRKLGCDIYRVKSPQKASFAYFSTVDRFFRENQGKFDVLHSNRIDSRSASILYYARKNGIKNRIVHSHTTVCFDNLARRFGEQYFFRPISMKLATDRCACSKAAGRVAYGSRAFHWVKNGLDLSRFEVINKEDVQKVRKELGIKEGEKVVGNVCRFVYQKNLIRLVEIFAKIFQKDSSTRLLLVGDGSDFESVQQKLFDCGLQNVAILPGFRKDVPVLMRVMDVFLLPSRYEGFGNVVTEAIASNMRCLISDVTPYPLYDDRVFALSLKDSNETWAQKTLEILRKPSINDGYAFIRKSGFDIKDTTDDLCEFYMKVMNNDPLRYL